LDAAAKKEILGLLFKKFIIKKASKAAACDCRIIPFWFAPFDKINSEPAHLQERRNNQIYGNSNGKITPLLHQDLRMASWVDIYHQLKPVLERLFGGAQ
jgi:hypothetical protein